MERSSYNWNALSSLATFNAEDAAEIFKAFVAEDGPHFCEAPKQKTYMAQLRDRVLKAPAMQHGEGPGETPMNQMFSHLGQGAWTDWRSYMNNSVYHGKPDPASIARQCLNGMSQDQRMDQYILVADNLDRNNLRVGLRAFDNTEDEELLLKALQSNLTNPEAGAAYVEHQVSKFKSEGSSLDSPRLKQLAEYMDNLRHAARDVRTEFVRPIISGLSGEELAKMNSMVGQEPMRRVVAKSVGLAASKEKADKFSAAYEKNMELRAKVLESAGMEAFGWEQFSEASSVGATEGWVAKDGAHRVDYPEKTVLGKEYCWRCCSGCGCT